ncbi:MAG TPA: hypothetical protein VHT04_08810 [Stellaceae bacterium]|jgi:hypothetical protein|nr:hypothetical protein [Stellaceae bacterium]
MTVILRLAAASALLGLSGCTGTPIFNVDYDAVYFPGETRANGPDITVLVRGNPSTLQKAEFDRSVTDAMQGWSFWPDHFTTAGDPNTAYRVVIIFNPPPTAGATVLCTRPMTADAVASGPGGSRVPVVATLCRGDYYMALADGSIAAPGGASDADFRTGIGLMTASLLPAQNPQRNGGPDCAKC